jgi:uncharacterized protein YdaL
MTPFLARRLAALLACLVVCAASAAQSFAAPPPDRAPSPASAPVPSDDDPAPPRDPPAPPGTPPSDPAPAPAPDDPSPPSSPPHESPLPLPPSPVSAPVTAPPPAPAVPPVADRAGKPAPPHAQPLSMLGPGRGPSGRALRGKRPSRRIRTGTGVARRSPALKRAAVTAPTSALVLYDTTGPFGWLGQTYGTMVANLASHFGSWTAKPVASYAAGDVDGFTATIYIGSTYDEPLPAAFLADVKATTRPVVWIYDNIWQLTASDPTFQADYGWMWSQFDNSVVNEVRYKGRSLTRDGTNNQAGIMGYAAVDAAKATVLADAVRADGSTFPWAVRSGNLTYIGEIPMTYFRESDRMMVFEDLLFDALAPATAERHRALVRLEDIDPESDPAQLRAIADYLFSKGIAFGFGVISRYRDPLGAQHNGRNTTVRLSQRPAVVSALRYLQSKGGTMIEHGWTHQFNNVQNPYNAVSGDDFEFYRTIENADHTLTFAGPVPGDSAAWADSRLTGAANDFAAAGLAVPTIFEFPHYFGSTVDYARVGLKFPTRWERALYPLGVLTGSAPDYSRATGQMFPYAVKDVYGTKVLPEDLGNVEIEPFFQFPTRFPAEIVADAARNLVIRDGVASFYFHPFLDVDLLRQTVEGIQALGYTFVDPRTL